MQQVNPLIRTKLHLPFTRPGIISRPRLQEQIVQGLCGPLTLITAPAGFGKTTLVASAFSDCRISIAWLSLDKDDNQAGRFLTYLVAALREADPTIGNEAEQLVAPAQQVPPEAILTSLINELDATSREIVLVLDDYQFIGSQAVHEAVAFLLDHCPRSFHLVIASRSDPPLPLARLRARGQTIELRAADLRFTESEAAQFLNDVMDLRLDAGSIAVLEERTEGWIAGLQLAALSMRDREDVFGFIEGFSGTNRYILDYLLEEVLAREPEEVQAFLLQTAFLTRLSGPLCDTVTGAAGSQTMLERLERRNLFVVPLDDDRHWYRYHHLFADLLKARLYQSRPDLVARLFSRAAEWCERDGQIAEAVSYALTAKDYERAADLIGRYWEQATAAGEIETVWSWLNSLPEDTIKNSAPLSAAYCWVLWLMGQVGAIEAHLVDADRALGELEAKGFDKHDAASAATSAAASAATFAQLPALLAVLHAFVARYHDEFETTRALAERALSLIPENLPFQDSAQLRSLGFLALASAYDGAGDPERAIDAYSETIRLSRIIASASGISITIRLSGCLRLLGRLRAADAACREALKYVQEHGMARLPATGILHVALSEVLVEQNDLEAAEAHLTQGMELGKWSGRLNAIRNAASALSRLRLARHDTHGALAAVQEAESALAEQAPLARAELLALRAVILIRQGSLSEAAQCAEEAVHLAGRDRGQTGQMVALAASRALIAECSPDEAVAHLTQSIAAAEESGRLGMAIELRILRSLALVRQGRHGQEAEADLARALALAEPEGYVRLFIDEGQPLQLLMADCRLQIEKNAPNLRLYLDKLLAAFSSSEVEDQKSKTSIPFSSAGLRGSATARAYVENLVEPLSERELQVLRLMAEGLTNEQIAARLIIALGTVKAHIHNISGKLGAQNRANAVARAKELNLL